MTDSMFSASWYRVASLRPHLRTHAEIHRHHYRGELWYVLLDRLTGRQHRFTPAAHYIIGLMDGRRTFRQIWEMANQHLGDDAPTQDEMIRLLGQLHGSDLLLCDVLPDSVELFQRQQKHKRSKWKQQFASPFSQRFPLWDPDAFLERWKFVGRACFSWLGGLLWLAVVATGLVLGLSHWTDLTMNLSDRVLAANNLVLLLLVYPVIKLLHELGHAFATKRWGGEVHELGVLLLVFVPVAYVEVSSASAFRDKRKRMLVGAAGMMVELFLAAICLLVWLNVQPGVLRSLSYDVILICSVSTLLFNINPLLRFDGYFILADAIEMPNLAARSLQYLNYVMQRYLFGVSQAQTTAKSGGERIWLTVYGIGSFGYRLFVTAVIILFVAQKFLVVGVVLALWGVATMILTPLAKCVWFLLRSPVIQRQRARSLAVSVALLLISLVALFLLPVPLATRAEGVVWLSEQSYVRAATGGFVRKVLPSPNSVVQRGEVLIETDDPLLLTRVALLEFQLLELEARRNAKLPEEIAEAQLVEEQIKAARASLARAREQVESLNIRSPSAGTFVVPNAQDLPDRWLRHGEVVAYVIQYPVTTVRAVVGQDRIGLVRARTRSVELRPADRTDIRYAATVVREVPAASHALPSKALGVPGGGEVATDPTDGNGTKAFETVFQFDLKTLERRDVSHVGSRVHVRFDHGAEPLAFQWYRTARQLFIRRYGI
jgi:putative peptide zinc metalloprotease protein